MANCSDYISADDLKTGKQAILHIEHVAKSEDASGNPALEVTDEIRGQLVTNPTLDGFFSTTGFKPADGSFEAGGTVQYRWQTLLYEADGQYYQWMGPLPKIVPAGSTPATTGGVDATHWVNQSDLTLRSSLAATDGVNLVNGAVKTIPYFNNLITGSHGHVTLIRTTEHHAGGSGGVTYKRSGTTGTPSTGNEVLCYDASGVGWKMIKETLHPFRSFGALGNGTDALAKFNMAKDFIGDQGGGVIYINSVPGFDDFPISDAFVINKSGVRFYCDPTVYVHMDVKSTDVGGAISFIGPRDNETTRLKNVGWRGGIVAANGTTLFDNAIGFSGCEDYFVVDVTIPKADRKAVTAQLNVVNGHFKNIRIGTTGFDAVTLEGDTVNGIIISRGMIFEDIVVTSAGRDGVRCEGGLLSTHSRSVVLRNVRIETAVRNGMAFDQVDNVYIEPTCRIIGCGTYGFQFANGFSLSGTINTITTQQAGLVLISSNSVNIDAVIANSGLSGAGVFDAIFISTPGDTHKINARVTGTTHRYTVNNQSTSYQPIVKFVNKDQMAQGTLGYSSGVGRVVAILEDTGSDVYTAVNPDVFGRSVVQMAATTFNLTTFVNPYVGKQITVHFLGNVTVVHGSSAGTIRLKGAVNVTPAAGSIMTFIYTNELLWREIARNF